MKNTKMFMALVVAFAMMLVSVFMLVACTETETHECKHVCQEQGCGKCLDKDCKDEACKDKCPGHEPATQPHACTSKCETCQKCTNANCNEEACKNKCQCNDVQKVVAAKIGETEYETLAAALTAAKADDTIVLQKDVKIETTIVITKKLTLDLNGKTLTSDNKIYNTPQEGAEQNNWSLISVQAGGDLTITGNGRVIAKEGGLDEETASCYAVDVRAEGAKLTIQNGEFIGNRTCVYVRLGAVEINGGKFSIYDGSTNEKMGHKFVLNLKDGAEASIVVKGGQFVKFNPAASLSENPEKNFVAEGYESKSETVEEVTIWTVSHVCKHVCPEQDCGKCLDPDCDNEACADKCPGHSYTITFVVGEDGTLDNDAQVEFVTALGGKLTLGDDEFLPEPTAKAAHWHFVGWFDAEEGGNAIDMDKAEFDFSQHTTYYARFARDNGIWTADGETFVKALTVNNGCTECLQYWFGGGSVKLIKDTEISVYIDGQLITFTFKVPGSISCVDQTGGNNLRRTSVKVTEDASFVVYVNYWSNSRSWNAEFTGTALNVPTTSEIPQGCDAITITFGDQSVTLYVVDQNGNAINSANASKFQIHAWNINNLFGDWAKNPTLDKGLEGGAGLTPSEAFSATTQWIIHWSGAQSSNFSNIEFGNTYVIKLSTTKTTVEMYVAPTTAD